MIAIFAMLPSVIVLISLSGMISQADLIVHGTVVAKNGDVVTVSVEETLKGGRTIQVVLRHQFGTTMVMGEECLLFLTFDKELPGFRILFGEENGRFRIQKGLAVRSFDNEMLWGSKPSLWEHREDRDDWDRESFRQHLRKLGLEELLPITDTVPKVAIPVSLLKELIKWRQRQ